MNHTILKRLYKNTNKRGVEKQLAAHANRRAELGGLPTNQHQRLPAEDDITGQDLHSRYHMAIKATSYLDVRTISNHYPNFQPGKVRTSLYLENQGRKAYYYAVLRERFKRPLAT